MGQVEKMNRQCDIALVSMPFPPLNQPSMALGLLVAALRNAGMNATALYPCFDFARQIGLDAYGFISDSKQELLVGEWVFAAAAFGEDAPEDPGYLDRLMAQPVTAAIIARSPALGDPRDLLEGVRAQADAFVDRIARDIVARDVRIVGCTSTFTQHVPSLALLRRIKTLAPHVVTMLGGANCEGAMGVATKRAFDWVDYVVSGEADLLLPELCRRALDGSIGDEPLPYGVIDGRHPALGDSAKAPRVSIPDMERTPTPDFDDYFSALASSPLAECVVPGLAMETSRGCWWGAKHHCTFCGLNGGNMAFRSKPADRVLEEFDGLAERYGITRFNVVDNILDLSYIQTLLPRLERPETYNLFYETKANLRRPHLEVLASAGVRRLQPGIENMHDEILRLIDKGTTALINLRLLKWARELGIFITWNFLWDVPGEQDAWYAEMAGWLPRVSHLQPPGIDRIQFHRFSPYHMRSAEFGLKLEPFESYRAVYPVSARDLADLAYYHQDARRRPAAEVLRERPGLRETVRLIALWNRAWLLPHEARPSLLWATDAEGRRVIDDTRPAFGGRHVPGDLEVQILEATEAMRSDAALAEFADAQSVASALEWLDARGLVLRQKGNVMSLVMNRVTPIPDAQEDFPGGYVDMDRWAMMRHPDNAAASLAAVDGLPA
ncbi:RiPP maturation radical SAM C-methyltransferase [Alteriqipengyuania lutimaris]|uniref:RiPP maturation radical SAM protein 1 n=1 Tax=Alteriqipengyuania lutimaris TaxID=1538146 RepID=A0A395LKG1_9SPHN|nr:RiPP maturation radical SAM C-methyltransferase [Alteriqipengyuania lutimaris]MBB3033835.1 magnesium-protoporphyrin IX monomethyl ester (oxidative) cyclase [Alteriqipengyuania lutimaris]RDS77195.1 RiPP maturation radical SAM protein 1 [Alteriqipengyuania lutimaris]